MLLTHLSYEYGAIGLLMAHILSGLSLTPPLELKKNGIMPLIVNLKQPIIIILYFVEMCNLFIFIASYLTSLRQS